MIETLKILMVTLLFTAVFTVLMRIVAWFFWYYDKDKSCPHVSYKGFREFYAVAPDHWFIGSDYLSYKGDRVELEKYSDLLKCRRFKKQLKKRGGELEKELQIASEDPYLKWEEARIYGKAISDVRVARTIIKAEGEA